MSRVVALRAQSISTALCLHKQHRACQKPACANRAARVSKPSHSVPLTLLCQVAQLKSHQALLVPVAACMQAPGPAPPRQHHHPQLPGSGAGPMQPRAPGAAQNAPQTCSSKGIVGAEREMMRAYRVLATQLLSIVSRCHTCRSVCMCRHLPVGRGTALKCSNSKQQPTCRWA